MQGADLIVQIDKLIDDLKTNKPLDDTTALLKQIRDMADKGDDSMCKKIHIFFMAFLPLAYYPNLERLEKGEQEAFATLFSKIEIFKTTI